MGAGKSHVGAALARKLDLDFFDSDKLVEARAGCSVSEVFERFGEEKFREAERNVILELLDGGPSVIATGGGAVTNERTLTAIKGKAVSIWLNPEMDLLISRLEDKSDRPLLKDGDIKQKLDTLFVKRKDLYAKADIALDITADNERQTLARLTKLLSEHLNNARF